MYLIILYKNYLLFFLNTFNTVVNINDRLRALALPGASWQYFSILKSLVLHALAPASIPPYTLYT